MKAISHVKDLARAQYNNRKRQLLKNYTPTIISRNCVGGIIYHNLGLKFHSPTINLAMDNPDFITFVENLELLTGNHAQLTECFADHCNWPCGELRAGEICVRIDFVHYKTFEEAKTKWFERVSRIDFGNLFIVWEYSDINGPDIKLWDRFRSLPYSNKVLITGNKFPVDDEHVVKLDLYGENYHYGKLLDYEDGTKFYKRYLDEFDYVRFLNTF